MANKFREFLDKCKCKNCIYKSICFDPRTLACTRYKKSDIPWCYVTEYDEMAHLDKKYITRTEEEAENDI